MVSPRLLTLLDTALADLRHLFSLFLLPRSVSFGRSYESIERNI